MHFLTTRIKSFKNYFLMSGVVKKRVFMHFQATKTKWLKTCFDAFAHTFRSPESSPYKNYFLTSGVVKNVFWCISRPQESSPQKNYFVTSGVVKNVFCCISRSPESSPQKNYFKRYFRTPGVVKKVFDAFPDHQNQVF